MLKLAVIGKDVSRSLSPKIHKFILPHLGETCEYDALSMSEAELAQRAETLFGEYDGFNVTIPHKQTILSYLSAWEGDAKIFGAVNTVVTATRTGYNTDGAGFQLMLQGEGISLAGKRALVLGAGGAGRSCISSLVSAGAVVSAYERSAERLAEVSRQLGGFTPLTAADGGSVYDVIVNCTGIGMHDTEGKTPAVPDKDGNDVLPALIDGCETAVDLIYVPKVSEFLRVAKQKGKKTVNGAAMLFYQAYCSDCYYLNCQRNPETAKELWNKFREINE